MRRRHTTRFSALTCLAAACVLAIPFLPACRKADKGAAAQKREAPAIPVAAAVTAQKSIPVQLRAVGTVEAFAVVGVKSQVAGQIKEVHFQEGQDVKQGDLLFSVDPATYENGVHQAEAALSASQARLANARESLATATRTLATDRKRGQSSLEAAQAAAEDARAKSQRLVALLAEKLVSQEEAETGRTAAIAAETLLRQAQVHQEELENQEKSLELQRQAISVAEAQVKADQASLESARLQLTYCTIRAPISGRTGNLLTPKGILVGANNLDVDMVVINQIQPINVAFSLPEQYQAEVRKLNAGSRKLAVTAFISGEEERPEEGSLNFIDNAVDNTNGTIRLKGLFSNADRRLWPGQFVQVVLTLRVQEGLVVAPLAAIQTGQNGQYVFVVKDDRTVEFRAVTVDRLVDQEAVVKKGLASGERVVTDGQLRLSPGSKVEIKK